VDIYHVTVVFDLLTFVKAFFKFEMECRFKRRRNIVTPKIISVSKKKVTVRLSSC